MLLPTNSIIVNVRQRLDLGNIDEMVDSMTRLGQITAITVERIIINDDTEYHLVDGMRRLTAAKKMHWENIEVIFKENLTVLQRQEMELEADTKRKDRTWQERVLAVDKLNTLKGYNDLKWTRQKLADALGQSVGNVSECLQIAAALKRTQNQTDEWSLALWRCENLYAALQHLALRVEDTIYAEIVRRKNAANAAMGFLPSTNDPLPASKIQNVNITDEPISRRVGIYNRYPLKDECHIALIFNPPELDLKYFEFLTDTGCAIIWFGGFGSWFSAQEQIESGQTGLIAMNYPLIWNTLKGQINPMLPFTRTYQCGLFVTRPLYRNHLPEAPKSAVMTAPLPTSGLPQSIIQQSLDAISSEGAKVWLPYGGPVVEVAQAGRTPIWLETEENTPDTLNDLKEYYKSQYGNVEFI